MSGDRILHILLCYLVTKQTDVMNSTENGSKHQNVREIN